MTKKIMLHLGRQPEQALAIIREQDGEILANYGQSVLVKIEEDGLNTLRAEGYRIRELTGQPTVQLGGFELDITHMEAQPRAVMALGMVSPSGLGHYILRLAGPMHPDWRAQLERMGLVIEERIANDDYLISVDSGKFDELQALNFVEALFPYQSALKINPILLTTGLRDTLSSAAMRAIEPKSTETPTTPEDPREVLAIHRELDSQPKEEIGNIEVVLFSSEDQLQAIDAVRTLGANVIHIRKNTLIVFVDESLVPRLAEIPQVRAVNPYMPPRLHNDVVAGIVHADGLHEEHDLDGSGQIIGIADTGLDTGVDDASMLADFQGRIVNIYALGRLGDASDPHNHGTHVAGSVLGDGANSNGQVHGIAPGARLVFQSLMDSTRGLGGIPADLDTDLFQVARDDGAVIHTNSWGAPEEGIYDSESEETDTFMFNNRNFLVLFAAGNWEPQRDIFGRIVRDSSGNIIWLTGINTPGTAKNALTVGASESTRTLPNQVQFPNSPAYPADEYPGGPVLPGLNEEADDQNDVASFSCIGPALHNRQKPDIVAPGTWILSTRSSVSVADTGPDGLEGTADEDGVFTHAEAVGMGLPGEPIYGAGDKDTPDAPPGSGPNITQNYYYSNGTSMATPITAGACALLRQYLTEQRGHTPSGALLKALVINGAIDMGMGIPHNGQGWGRLDLTNTLFPLQTNRVQYDDSLDNAAATGDIRIYDVFVSSASSALAVTLVWRDPPGSLIQNPLHLRVVHVGSGAEWTAESIADVRNNVQKIVVDPPPLGLYHIEVEGIDVTTGVPELAGLRQDYALVVSNAIGFSCNPSDIVQLIDRSGSMGFSGYMEPAKERAKQMIDILQINDRVGVVTFAASSSPDDPVPLTRIDSQDDKDAAHSAIDLVHSSGNTDLREALADGLTTLGPDAGRPRAMVFLSDGKHTVSTAEIDDPFLDSIAAANVKVYTIALGPASDFDVLDNIANRTGTGSTYTVESAAHLHKLHEIYYDILGSMSCGGVVHLSSAPVGLERQLIQEVAIDRTVHEAQFAVSWEQARAKLKFYLEDPSGNTYNSSSQEVFHLQGSTHQFYRVAMPGAGIWKMIVKPEEEIGEEGLTVTTAAITDSTVKCEVRLDPQFLFQDKVLLYLKAYHGETPLVGGQAVARITFPTLSIKNLLEKYHDELTEVEVDPEKLAGDADDLELVKLGLLTTRYAEQGRDIYERQTIDIPLHDDGRAEDPNADDGIYTAFFDPKQAGVAGNFQIQVSFDVEDEEIGTHRCTKLLPVYVPQPEEIEPTLMIEDILVRRNSRWGYTIIGARIAWEDGTAATPDDGVQVNMTLRQGLRTAKSGDLPYYRRGKYFIWRHKEARLSLPTIAQLTVFAKLDGQVVSTASKRIVI